MLLIISCVIGALIGAGVLYAILAPKVKQRQFLDDEIVKKNNQEAQRSKDIQKEIEIFNERLTYAKQSFEDTTAKTREMMSNLKEQERHIEDSVNEYRDKCVALINKEIIEIQQKYENAEADYEQQYLATMADMVATYRDKISASKDEYWKLVSQLDDLQRKVDAAVEAAKREEEMANKQEYYRLQLSKEDLDEICRLQEIVPFLRSPEPLYKVIYKMYYEKPYTDLVGRVVGSGVHCGIYKITNLQNKMCYIGQSANIAERWRQHIKRGVGAETATRNKLYTAMKVYGVENFTFEIVEECERSLLNERESYWQDYFKAKEFGYSIR